jgi:hypothetical protein
MAEMMKGSAMRLSVFDKSLYALLLSQVVGEEAAMKKENIIRNM